MKILHIIRSDSPKLGGPTAALAQILNAMINRGVKVVVATTRDSLEWKSDWESGQPLNKGNAVFYYFRSKHLTRWAFSLKLWCWLHRNIKDYDLIHIHGVFTFPPLAASYWARKYNIPYIVRPAGTLSVWSLQQKKRKKWIYCRFIINPILNNAKSIHVTSEAENASIALLGYGKKAVVLPLGVPVFPATRIMYNNLQRPLQLLFIGRIHPVKNLPLLIRAVSKLVDEGISVELSIVGDGDPSYLAEIRRLIKELGIQKRINLPGFVQGTKKSATMAKADLFILPSFHENFGVAVVEAMAMGLPVVISDQVGIAAEVSNADAGSIVEVGNLASLVSAIQYLHEPNVRARMGRNARKLVETHFSLDIFGRGLLEYYHQTVGGKLT